MLDLEVRKTSFVPLAVEREEFFQQSISLPFFALPTDRPPYVIGCSFFMSMVDYVITIKHCYVILLNYPNVFSRSYISLAHSLYGQKYIDY